MVHLEMLNVLVALSVWCRQLEGKVVQIHCDNLAVVNVLNNGRGRDPYLLTVARNNYMLLVQEDLTFQMVHIPGKCNVIAVLLYRWYTGINGGHLTKLLSKYEWVELSPEMYVVETEI